MAEPVPNPKLYEFDVEALNTGLAGTPLEPHVDALIHCINDNRAALIHGEYPRWQHALDHAPEIAKPKISLQANTVSVLGEVLDHGPTVPSMTDTIRALMPWRKGPFQIADVFIDTEWRSDWKWQRIEKHLSPLIGRTVLDVGCGSGYHLWRMRGAGAALAVGIEPNLIFNLQFNLLQHYINDDQVHCLPLTMELLPKDMRVFDTVFSMGVLYHRRDPQQHLQQLLDALTPGGELVLETLVMPSGTDEDTELELDGRYARMRNIWVLPSVARVTRWVLEAGFSEARCVDLDVTSLEEQRTTDYMPHQSLIDSLDATNHNLTIEGHPRPHRATWIVRK